MTWLIWTLPVGLFWPVVALYLGGMRELQGGGPVRQIIGLLDSFVAFLLLWWVLGRLLSPIGSLLGGIILPTVLSVLALPLLTAVGFRLVGVRVVREAAAH